MDNRQLDDLTRMIASGSPRRWVLGAMAAILTGSLGPQSANVALAACQKVGKTCDKNEDCCDHAECKSGKCRCKNGFKNCDGKCKNLKDDEKHCGNCNNRCGNGERCCNGNCVDVTGTANCGACGNRCGENEECVDGACLEPPGNCPVGADPCSDGEAISCGNSPGCQCNQTTEGHTVCGDARPGAPGGVCGQCQSSADCRAILGPQAFCVKTKAPCCLSDPVNQNVCRVPCDKLTPPR